MHLPDQRLVDHIFPSFRDRSAEPFYLGEVANPRPQLRVAGVPE
jgi:hypothetical protein